MKKIILIMAIIILFAANLASLEGKVRKYRGVYDNVFQDNMRLEFDGKQIRLYNENMELIYLTEAIIVKNTSKNTMSLLLIDGQSSRIILELTFYKFNGRLYVELPTGMVQLVFVKRVRG